MAFFMSTGEGPASLEKTQGSARREELIHSDDGAFLCVITHVHHLAMTKSKRREKPEKTGFTV